MQHFLLRNCLYLVLLSAIFTNLHGQVVINEFSAANTTGATDNYGNNEDWIELFNTTGAAVNLSGWHLSDQLADPTKYTIPAGVTIAANGFLRFWASGRNVTVGTNYHTNFRITQTQASEDIVLANAAGVVIDSNPIDVPNQENHSWGRSPNGNANWRIFTTTTPNATNGTSVLTAYATTPNITPASGRDGQFIKLFTVNFIVICTYH